MKRFVALKIRLVLLMLGLCLGPALWLSVSANVANSQKTTRDRKREEPRPYREPSHQRPGPPPVITRLPPLTPAIPEHITLHIRTSPLLERPSFFLWSKGLQGLESSSVGVDDDLDGYVITLRRGMDPAKKYWIVVHDGPLSGEAPIRQPYLSGQEVPVFVELHEAIKVTLTIEGSEYSRSPFIFVRPAGSDDLSTLPHRINDDSQAIFSQGFDPRLSYEVYAPGFKPTRIENNEIIAGRFEKMITLEPLTKPDGDGTSREGEGDKDGQKSRKDDGKGSGISLEFLKPIIAPVVVIIFLGIIAYGVFQIYWMRPETPVPPQTIRMSPPAPPRGGVPNSTQTASAPEPEYPGYVENDREPTTIVHREDSPAHATEPGTHDVPFKLTASKARQAYKSLIHEGALSRPPLTLDIMLNDGSNKKGEQLKETMDRASKFVLFTNGNEKGWLFPNPARSVRETEVEQIWQLIFEGLTKDEFERKMDRLRPVEATRRNSGGQNIWNAKPDQCKFD